MHKVCTIIKNTIKENTIDRIGCLLDQPIPLSDATDIFHKIIGPTSTLTEKQFSQRVKYITLTFRPSDLTHDIHTFEEELRYIRNKDKQIVYQKSCLKVLDSVQKDSLQLYKLSRQFVNAGSPRVRVVLFSEIGKNGQYHLHGVIIGDTQYIVTEWVANWHRQYGFTYSSKKTSINGWLEYCTKDYEENHTLFPVLFKK